MVDRRLPAPATGKNSASPILCFLRISDHLESICKNFFFSVKMVKKLSQIFGNFWKVKFWHRFLKICSPTTFIDRIC